MRTYSHASLQPLRESVTCQGGSTASQSHWGGVQLIHAIFVYVYTFVMGLCLGIRVIMHGRRAPVHNLTLHLKESYAHVCVHTHYTMHAHRYQDLAQGACVLLERRPRELKDPM